MKNIFWIINFLAILDHYLLYCIEYNPFTILVNRNSHLSISCFLSDNATKTRWHTYNTNFEITDLHNDSYHTISPNGTLNIFHLKNTQLFYQCASVSKTQILFEKIFRIVSIENLFNINLLNFDEIFKPSTPILFTSKLIVGKNTKLIWIMWKNNRFYDISLSNKIVQFDSSIKVMILSLNNDLSFVACLKQTITNLIITCDKPHFIRSSKLDEHSKVMYSELNDDVILQCRNANDNNKYRWFKNGKLLEFGERITNYGNIISIRNITADDYGYYQCYISKPFTLPYKLSIFLINFYNSSGLFHSFVKMNDKKSPLNLPCKNQSTAIPSFIYWNFHKISSFSQLLNATNLSPKLPDQASGLFQCLINDNDQLHVFSYFLQYYHHNNKISADSDNKRIILKKRSIDDVSITNFDLKSTSNSIRISWSQPIVPVRTYTINWGNLYPGPGKQIISGKETKFVIESLNCCFKLETVCGRTEIVKLMRIDNSQQLSYFKNNKTKIFPSPATNYYVKIDIDTVKGTGKSYVQPVMTKKENKEIVPKIPVNLKLVEVGDTWAKISWNEDNIKNGEESKKTIFQVEYYSIRNQNNNNHNRLNLSSTVINIKDMNPATTYEIMVRNCLVNSSKCSDYSMVLEFTTQETKPSDPPQHLTLSTVQIKNVPSDNTLTKNRFAIQVSWQPPKKPNGEIKNYLIFVTADKKLDVDNWGERTVSGKALNTVIDRLDLNRYYYFRIGCSNEYGKSPLSSIRIFKTPDENGKNGGPITLSKEYYDATEITEELKIQTSNERGNDNLVDSNTNNNETKNKNMTKLSLTNYKWWIIIGIVFGAILVFILIILFLVAAKCRNEHIPYENGIKIMKGKNVCDVDYMNSGKENIKFVNKVPILTTPDLFRHTNDQNCHQNYLEMEERTDSPNSFSSNKAFPSQSHNTKFTSHPNYHGISGHYTPPGLIHQQNMVMTTSQLTSNSNERQFYQVPFMHHMGHNQMNVFTSSAPRVNAAASDFNSINIPSPISGYSDFTSSQATVLYDTSTAKSSGGKSSLSGSGSYNNGLASKAPLVNEPINEGMNNCEKSTELENNKSSDAQNLISKAFSSEELCLEMANLEGLMKDLSSITQKEFEC